MVWGRDVAAQVVPFSIRAGHQTEVALAPRTGVRVRLELTTADGAVVGPGATLAIRRGASDSSTGGCRSASASRGAASSASSPGATASRPSAGCAARSS